MKKKLLCALLSAALVASLTLGGCASKEEPAQPAPEATETVEETVDTAEAAVDEIVDEPSETDDEVLQEEGGRGDYISFCPALNITKESHQSLDEDGNWLMDSYYPVVSVFSDAVDVSILDESLSSANTKYKESVEDRANEIDELFSEGDELLMSLETSPEFPLTSATLDVFPSRVDENIISLVEFYYYFAGGAHPSYEYDATVMDVNTGKTLSLEDVISDMDGFSSYAVSKALEIAEGYTVDKDMMFYDGFEENINDITGHRWYLDASGIEFIFNPEEIAPYAVGLITFCMPYDEILSYMVSNYIPNNEDGILAMPINSRCQATVIDGMMVSASNGSYEGPAVISAGNVQYTITEGGYITDAYLLKRTMKQYVFANYYDNGRLNFAVFDVTGGEVKEIYSQTDVGFIGETLSEDTFTLRSETDEDYSEVLSMETVIPFE